MTERPTDQLKIIGDLNKFIAKEQNILDHLTARMYGPGVSFDRLSAWGQNTIESLARDSQMFPEVDPTLRTAAVEIYDLRREVDILKEKLASALQREQDLFEENEDLKMEVYINERERDEEEYLHSRGTRIREEGTPRVIDEQFKNSDEDSSSL